HAKHSEIHRVHPAFDDVAGSTINKEPSKAIRAEILAKHADSWASRGIAGPGYSGCEIRRVAGGSDNAISVSLANHPRSSSKISLAVYCEASDGRAGHRINSPL